MKLANIKYPLKPYAALLYAQENNFKILEITAKEEESPTSTIITTIQICIESAIEKGCVEFCFRDIRPRYNINEDTHSWIVTIFGFIETDKLTKK